MSKNSIAYIKNYLLKVIDKLLAGLIEEDSQIGSNNLWENSQKKERV